MAIRREPVRLSFDGDALAEGMKISAEQAGKVFAQWTLHDATWEPHDWSEFG